MFFKAYFLLLLLLECFAPPEIWVMDLHWVKIMCSADLKMLYSKKSHSLIIFFYFSVQNLEIIENTFFMTMKKKNIKCFAEKSFAPLNASKHTKTCFDQMFYTFMKNAYFFCLFIISRLFTKKYTDIAKLCDFILKGIFKSALHMIFLNVNLKPRFLEVKNI